MSLGSMVSPRIWATHEDDAERVVRCGLRSIDAVGRLDAGLAKLQARVGIATGLVVVGDLIGEGSRRNKRSSARPQPPGTAAGGRGARQPGDCPPARGNRSANCSSWKISEQNSLPALPATDLNRLDSGYRLPLPNAW